MADAARPRARELAFVALGLAVLVAVMLGITRGWLLFTRPLWVDEWFTVLVASHRSPVDVIGDLRHGADGGASLYHLCVWAMYAVGGDLSPVALRALSLGMVIGALVTVYHVLRRRFSVDASVAGALAVGAHELVIAHAFDARFYPLWLFCCALYAASLGSTRARDLKIAVTAALLVASHWYGIITLGLMAAAAFASRLPRWREGARLVAPSVAGVVALALISPLARGQRAAITVNSWIPDSSTPQMGLTNRFWFETVPLAAAAVILLAVLFAWPRDRARSVRLTARDTLADPALVACLALALLPVALPIVSVAGLPSMLGRYAIPAVLAWAPVVAFAADVAGRWPARAFALVLLGFWLVAFRTETRRRRAFAIGVRYQSGVLARAEGMRLPLVFQSLHTMYPQVAAARGAGGNVMYLDLPDSTLDAAFPRETPSYQANKGLWLERDFARVHAVRFGFPKLATQAALDTTPRFLLLATAVRMASGESDAGSLARAAFPHHTITPVADDLLLLERSVAPPSARTR